MQDSPNTPLVRVAWVLPHRRGESTDNIFCFTLPNISSMTRYLTQTTTLLVCAFLIGCGTIIHGGSQDVSVTSDPSGATVGKIRYRPPGITNRTPTSWHTSWRCTTSRNPTPRTWWPGTTASKSRRLSTGGGVWRRVTGRGWRNVRP